MSDSEAKSVALLAKTAYQDYAQELHRFLVRRVRRPQDADDLAQEVFARLLRVRDAELIRKPLAYLFGIAFHVVREFRQRNRSERVVFDSQVTDELCETSESFIGLDEADVLDLRRRLNEALRHLSPTHQLVLLLVKRDGLSYSEAAAASGLSVHTVEKYLVEARARLRVILAAQEGLAP